MSTFLAGLRSIALLVARLALGGIMIAHGWQRWQINTIANEIAYLQQFQTPYAGVAAWSITMLELVGGVFLVAGALTPIVAGLMLIEQILFISYTSWFNGPYLIENNNTFHGGYEYNVALAALALVLLVYGGGAIAVDRLFRKKPVVEDEDVDPIPAPGTGSGVRTTPPAPRPVTPTPAAGPTSPASPPPASGSNPGTSPGTNTANSVRLPAPAASSGRVE